MRTAPRSIAGCRKLARVGAIILSCASRGLTQARSRGGSGSRRCPLPVPPRLNRRAISACRWSAQPHGSSTLPPLRPAVPFFWAAVARPPHCRGLTRARVAARGSFPPPAATSHFSMFEIAARAGLAHALLPQAPLGLSFLPTSTGLRLASPRVAFRCRLAITRGRGLKAVLLIRPIGVAHPGCGAPLTVTEERHTLDGRFRAFDRCLLERLGGGGPDGARRAATPRTVGACHPVEASARTPASRGRRDQDGDRTIEGLAAAMSEPLRPIHRARRVPVFWAATCTPLDWLGGGEIAVRNVGRLAGAVTADIADDGTELIDTRSREHEGNICRCRRVHELIVPRSRDARVEDSSSTSGRRARGRPVAALSTGRGRHPTSRRHQPGRLMKLGVECRSV